MIHEGEIFKKLIVDNNINRTKLAQKLGFGLSYLYQLYEKVEIPDQYKRVAASTANVSVRDYFPTMEIDKIEELYLRDNLSKSLELNDLQRKMLKLFEDNQNLNSQVVELEKELSTLKSNK